MTSGSVFQHKRATRICSLLTVWCAALFLASCGDDAADVANDGADGAGGIAGSQATPAGTTQGGTEAEPDRSASGPAAEVAAPECRIACVGYQTLEGGRRENRQALAVAIRGPEGVEGSFWIAALPGFRYPDHQTAVTLYPVYGEIEIPIINYRRNSESQVVGRDEKAGLFVIHSNVLVPAPELAAVGLEGADSLWLLDTGEDQLVFKEENSRGGYTMRGRPVDNLRRVPVNGGLQAGESFALAEEPRVALSVTMAPLTTASGEWAGLAVRDEGGSWTIKEIPEIGKLIAPSEGPFVVTTRLSPRLDHLEVEFEGSIARGLRRGNFMLVLGHESDALQGFDEEGRRYLVDLKAPGRSGLEDQILNFDPETGMSKAKFGLRLESGAQEHVLVGQLLLVPGDSQEAATPYPPFTLKVMPGPAAGIEILGNEAFRLPGEDRSGKSAVALMDDARILELPAEVLSNRAVCTGNRILLPTTGAPAVHVYEIASDTLRPLGSELDGKALRLAADTERAYLLSTESGILEVWNLNDLKLVTAGLLEGAGEVLAMAPLEGQPDDLLVLACRNRFRFLSVKSLEERMPELVSASSGDRKARSDYGLYLNSADLIDAVAMRSVQGGLIAFRGVPGFGPEANIASTVAMRSDERFGRLSTRIISGPSSLGPHGITYFSESAMRQDDAFPMGRKRTWKGRAPGFEDKAAVAGCFVGPENLDPVFVVRQIEGALPPLPPRIEVHSRNRPGVEPISLGQFPELSGCRSGLGNDAPIFTTHVFAVPEAGCLITLSDDGRRLYRRELDTGAMITRLGGGSFSMLVDPPSLLHRGLPFRYRLAVGGCSDPRIELEQGPPGAEISADGLLSWDGSGDHFGDEVAIRVRVTDGEPGRELSMVMNAKLIGPVASRTRASTPSGEAIGGVLSPRVFDVPGGAVILDKVEVAAGRFQLLVTESPEGSYRLEVFDASAEKWMVGGDLPGRPALVCANPRIVYMLYPEQGVLELRGVEEPGKVRKVPLKLPIAAMGCSTESTEGVLCVVERLTPESVKVGEIIDWDGSRMSVSRTTGPRARMVFLSPLALKPMKIPAREEDLNQAVFFLGSRPDSRPELVAVSPDGWQIAVENYHLDLRGGEGPARLSTHSLGFKPLWISGDGARLYDGGNERFDRSEDGNQPVGTFQKVKPPFADAGVRIRPVPARELELGTVINPPESFVSFREVEGGAEVLRLGPLPEIPEPRDLRNLLGLYPKMAAVFEDKLITIGNPGTKLVVRSFSWP